MASLYNSWILTTSSETPPAGTPYTVSMTAASERKVATESSSGKLGRVVTTLSKMTAATGALSVSLSPVRRPFPPSWWAAAARSQRTRPPTTVYPSLSRTALAAASLPSELCSCPTPSSFAAAATVSPAATHTPSASRTPPPGAALPATNRKLGGSTESSSYGRSDTPTSPAPSLSPRIVSGVPVPSSPAITAPSSSMLVTVTGVPILAP
mmetsp:Transcript_8496/g.21078  ORF Transcript_8496/g.21078 Transcript_8496/m.21078 type:complete len:210 (-) Transcript_8496:1062-1691(-)